MPRPRLLFLGQTLPYPPDGGVWIRSYHVLRLLSREFDVTALCFERAWGSTTAWHHDVEGSLQELGRYASIEVFELPQLHSRTRLLTDHVRSLATRRVYTRYLYRSRPFRRRLKDVLRKRGFDIVHADSMDLSGYFPELGDLPVICVHHNVESELLRRRAAVQKSAVRAAYLNLQASLMEHEERRWCPRVTLNVTVSEQDAQRLLSIAPGARFGVVPNGVDTNYFQPQNNAGEGLVYVGGTNWFPNRDALEWFAADVLPLIRNERADLPVTWVGRASDTERKFYEDRYGITVTGYVTDIRPYVARADCYIVPLRVGGGTRLKILDAWAMGMPIVSTSIGCEGLDAHDGENIIIRDDAVGFARGVLNVLNGSMLRTTLSAAGRETVERLYSWDVIGRAMHGLYRSALK